MKQSVSFKLNNQNVSVEVNGDESLLTIIRTYLDKTGTKFGCGLGDCGACTVLIDNEAARSCMILIEDVANKEIITIEGLATGEILHPIQKAFITLDALQCGFCTPGMIMNALGLLIKNPTPTRNEIINGMEDNLCRCGSYNRIVEAIEMAAKEMNKKVKI
ncbi:carbon-monoxide dehydrogenase small subunit [Lutibacter oceani]|uniref:Carbon-monoxide dehydrogenase small subunit n=1 Tax=Lutibacter oceani TaxID=1853311 RepID=A0A3D9RVY4_9FLAO|nr:(2Fe-2S)-binding protein [Lutibacter oceani]REE83628.1 carbon-monoxide dehydrogenase small subunit [Lutibacter oceani]